MRHLELALARAAGWLLFALLLMICINVALRYVVGDPIIWLDQVTGYSLVYVTFLGAPWVLTNRKHVAIEVVRMRFTAAGRLWLDRLVHLLCFLYCAAFTYLSVMECAKLVKRGAAFADVIEVPEVIIYGVMPLGAGLMTLTFFMRLVRDESNLSDDAPEVGRTSGESL